MPASRGDRKPCTHAGCSGTMQFGREPLPKTPEMMTADGEPGWICSDHAEHFQLASALPIASTRAQASGVNQEGATASTTFNPR